MITKVIPITIAGYVFDKTTNPYAFDAKNQKSLKDIANKIQRAIEENFGKQSLLIRGIQSQHHKETTAKKLVDKIIEKGDDNYKETSASRTIYGAELTKDTILSILGGFHNLKPKCDERPQYPVDIWMIFDKNFYKNIEYLHPRHNVLVRDKWQRINKDDSGLLGIFTINLF